MSEVDSATTAPAPVDDFAVATKVRRRPDVSAGAPASEVAGEVVYDATVHDGWDIGGRANGGYLLAIAGRAMSDLLERPPLTVTAHYLAPAPAGACTVHVETVRSGRRMATATASLRQGDSEVVRVLGTFAVRDPDPDRHPTLVTASPPDLPPFAACVEPPAADEGPLPALNDRLAVRLRPGDDGFRTATPSGRAELAGWFGFRDGGPIDELALLLASDAFAPPVFNTDLPVAWVPTLELTVHVRAVPAPGRIACTFRSRFISGGYLEEDGELWDERGALVAQSRQLSLVPRAEQVAGG